MLLHTLFVVLSSAFAHANPVEGPVVVIESCPEIECPLIDCGESVIQTFQVGEEQCQECPQCPQTCPLFSCPIPEDCESPQPTFFSLDDGTICTGCPECPNQNQEATPCPQISCLRPPCRNPRPTYLKGSGKSCLGCYSCPKKCYEIVCAACVPPADYEPEYDESGCELCPPCDIE